MKSLFLGVAIFLGVSAVLSFDNSALARMGSHKADKAAKHASDRSLVLNFEAGSSDLTTKDQESLRSLVSKIGIDHVDRIDVAAWSDKAFPKTGSDLAKTDRDLAEARASKINDFLKSSLNVSGMRIKSFNMAETSNWLSRAMRTEDAELKSMFAKDQMAPIERRDFDYIAKEGAPQHAVVVVVRK